MSPRKYLMYQMTRKGTCTSCLALLSLMTEQTWPSTHETLLTTWKIVAFTATSVLLVLLLVILARMFQTKFKAHFPPRSVHHRAQMKVELKDGLSGRKHYGGDRPLSSLEHGTLNSKFMGSCPTLGANLL